MTKSRSAANRYLRFPAGSSIIWFQLGVPKPLQAKLGRTHINESLGTTDVRVARVLAGKRRAELMQQWGAIPLPSVPQTMDLEDVAVAVGFDQLVEHEERRRRGLRGVDREQYERRRRRVAINLRLGEFLAGTGDDSFVRCLADAAIEEFALDLPPESEGYLKLCDLLNTARLAGLQISQQRIEGNTEAETESPLVQRVRAKRSRQAEPGESLAELFERYAAERVQVKGKRTAGVDQDRMVIGQFAEFVGAGRAASSITYDDAKGFADLLETLPAGYKKRKDYRGLDIRQAAAKGARDGHKPLGAVTQNRYISTLSPFFDWLRSERGGRKIAENPFAGLLKDVSKIRKANTRQPFTMAQIERIVHSPLYAGFAGDGREHVPGNERADDWRRWLPLIGMFTGARCGEVAQLHIGDVRKIDGVWCFEFRHDEATGQQTKSDKTRIVAVHSTLLKMGLVEFVQRRQEEAYADRNPQLFPALKPGKRGQYGDKPSKWFRDYLAKIGIKDRTGGDSLGFHSFRHTMADQLRAAGQLDAVFGPLILGHSSGSSSVTKGYGQASQGTPKLSSDLIESVRFVPIERGRAVEGGKPVDFSHMFVVGKRM